jgi:hypothetical protein
MGLKPEKTRYKKNSKSEKEYSWKIQKSRNEPGPGSYEASTAIAKT